MATKNTNGNGNPNEIYWVKTPRTYLVHGEERTDWDTVGRAFRNKDGETFTLKTHLMPAPVDGQWTFVIQKHVPKTDR